MNSRKRQLACMFLMLLACPVIAQDLGHPTGSVRTMSFEPSEANLQIQVDQINASKESMIEQYGPRHPMVGSLKRQLEIATDSLNRMRHRNDEINRKAEREHAAKDSAFQRPDFSVMIQLQQSMLQLTQQLSSMEYEVRTLKSEVARLTKSNSCAE